MVKIIVNAASLWKIKERKRRAHKRRRDGEWVLKGRRRKREKGGGT